MNTGPSTQVQRFILTLLGIWIIVGVAMTAGAVYAVIHFATKWW